MPLSTSRLCAWRRFSSQTFDVNRETMDRCVTFYNFKYDGKTVYNDREIMQELPTSIRQELLLHRYASTIEMLPFLAGIRADIAVEVCQQFHQFPVMPGDLVMKKGAYGNELLILIRGVARSVPDLDADGDTVPLQEYEVGSFFGELEFLGVRDKRDVSVQVLTQFVHWGALHLR